MNRFSKTLGMPYIFVCCCVSSMHADPASGCSCCKPVTMSDVWTDHIFWSLSFPVGLIMACNEFNKAKIQEQRDQQAKQFKGIITSSVKALVAYKDAERYMAAWNEHLQKYYQGSFEKMMIDDEDSAECCDTWHDGCSTAAMLIEELVESVYNGSLPYDKKTFDDYKALLLTTVPYINAQLLKPIVNMIFNIELTKNNDVSAAQAYCKEFLTVALTADDPGCFDAAIDRWCGLHKHDPAALQQAITFVQDLITRAEQSCAATDFRKASMLYAAINSLIRVMYVYEQPGADEYAEQKVADALARMRRVPYDVIVQPWLDAGIKVLKKAISEVYVDLYKDNFVGKTKPEHEPKELTPEQKAVQKSIDALKELINGGRDKVLAYFTANGLLDTFGEALFRLSADRWPMTYSVRIVKRLMHMVFKKLVHGVLKQ